jgi:membrane peptidoglycan carboxypeptidase
MTAAAAPRHCHNVPPGYAQAELVLVRARVADGGVTRVAYSTLGAFDRAWQLGSLGKLPIMVAAVRQGLGPDTPVCPRVARADGRRLRRETRPEYGFVHCGPAQMISLAEATATSDSLAYYDLARQLGESALGEAAQALGLPADDGNGATLAYALAFGTATATPTQILAMGQAVFGVAEGLQAHAAAPQLLQLSTPEPALAWQRLDAMLPQAGPRAALRELVRAPVHHPRGTLFHLAGTGAQAGKTGTTSSAYAPSANARPYQQSRLSLTWQPGDQTVALAIVAGNAPQPLGQARLPAQVIQPIREALLR